jgi:ParB family chromosome partitioning protein
MTIPAIVKILSDQEVAEIALIENLQREGLNFFEEAEGYQRLLSEFNLTQEEVAQRVGKSQSNIANKLRLLKLSPIIRDNLDLEIITERHARALLRLPSTELQVFALKQIYEKELNVRETEAFIAEQLALQGTVLKNNKEKHIVRIFTDIRLYLNTLRTAVATIKEAGLEVKMQEKDYDSHVEVLIKIHKPSNERKRVCKQ